MRVPFLVVLGGTIWSALILADNGARLGVLALSAAAGIVFANVAISLPFEKRSARYSRALADAMACLIGFVVILFYYATDVVLLIASASGLILFLGAVVLVDRWWDLTAFLPLGRRENRNA
jgi:FtsH-binding integral membrane protein